MTALKVDPNGLFLRLTEKPSRIIRSSTWSSRAACIFPMPKPRRCRDYLLNGGFLWLDDFWGEEEWDNMADEMKKVFPNRDFVELPLTNQLYHCVFEITAKRQVPNVQTGDPQPVRPAARHLGALRRTPGASPRHLR